MSLFLTLLLTSRLAFSTTCVKDVPSPEFLSTSITKYISISTDTYLEVQFFNQMYLTKTSTLTPLLFIHGYMDSRFSFLSTIQCINTNDRLIIVPSLRGFGDSQIYNKSSIFTIEQFTNDLIMLLDKLNINKAVWIGHSMGSFIAHYAAGNYKNYVDSVVLVASGSFIPVDICDWVTGNIVNNTCTDRDFIDIFQEKDTMVNDISQAYANQVLRESYKVDIMTSQLAWYRLCEFNDAKFQTYVGNINMKVKIIWGSNDTVLPVDQNFVNSFTGTTPEVTILDNVGHNVQWFEPGKIANLIYMDNGDISKSNNFNIFNIFFFVLFLFLIN